MSLKRSGRQLSRRHMLGGLAAAGLAACKPRLKADSGARSDSGGSTPTDDGFSVPAEWGEHAGCLMQWPPADHYCFVGQSCGAIERARAEWAATAQAIARFEPVVVYARGEDMAEAQRLLGGGVAVVEAPLDDGWSRDTGPILLRGGSGEVRAACFGFNGWGGSVSYEDDAVVKWQMCADLGVRTYDHPMILEGGAVIMDGLGTLITTEECLLHRTRNPDLSKSAQEQILKDYLGARRVIWLENGWTPDPLTNGHVDGVAAFVEDNVVLLCALDDARDPNFAILEDANTRLLDAGLEVLRMPSPSLTAFHINFYRANGALIVPIEGRAAIDDAPLGVLRDAHPGLEVVGVVANELGAAGGGVHCITQQVPLGVSWPF